MTPAGRPRRFTEADWEVTRERAERLRSILKALQMSARVLAQRLKGAGLSRWSAASVGKYLNASRILPEEFLVDVADELRIPPGHLLHGGPAPELDVPASALPPEWREWRRANLTGQRLRDSRGFALIAFDAQLRRLGVDEILRTASVGLARTALDSSDAAIDATKRGTESEPARQQRHQEVLKLLIRDIRKVKSTRSNKR